MAELRMALRFFKSFRGVIFNLAQCKLETTKDKKGAAGKKQKGKTKENTRKKQAGEQEASAGAQNLTITAQPSQQHA